MSNIPSEPLTRRETYLAKAAGQNVNLPSEDLTREEEYLRAIAESSGGGGDVMQGATSTEDGVAGIVPKPLAGDQDKVLYGSGEWKEDTIHAPKGDIAPTEISPSTHGYSAGELLYYNGTLYKAKTAIVVGDTLTVGTNIEAAVVFTVLNDKINAEVEELLDREFHDLYGLCTKTTTIGTNQQGNKEITETDSGASITAVTVISTVNGNKQIVTTVTPTAGDYYYVKTTVIASTASGKTITESYTKEAKA